MGKIAKKNKKPDNKAKSTGLKKIGTLSTYTVKKTYKELKREAVIRGMPFPDVVNADVHRLIYYIEHSNEKPNISLIDKFDDWVDGQLEMVGYKKGSSMRSPRLRLGFIGEDDEDGNPKTKRIKGIPKPPKKAKRERDESGLFKGTKKSYTYELYNRGFSLERVNKRVLRKFPDASEKSIKIWYGAAKRASK